VSVFKLNSTFSVKHSEDIQDLFILFL